MARKDRFSEGFWISKMKTDYVHILYPTPLNRIVDSSLQTRNIPY